MSDLYAHAPPEPGVPLRRFTFRGVASIVAAVSLGLLTVPAPASAAETTARTEPTATAAAAGPTVTATPGTPTTDPTAESSPTDVPTPADVPTTTGGSTRLPALAGHDLAAVGAHVKAGTGITVRVGIVNRGPTAIRAGAWKGATVQFAETWGWDMLSRVTSASVGCQRIPESLPPIPLPPNWIPDVFVTYWSCSTSAELKPGRTLWFEFTGDFGVTRGHIEIGSAYGRDRNPANDRADIILSATGPTTATTRPPAGPGLPVTGERMGATVAVLAGLGTLLLLAGLVTIGLVRRRPARAR